MISTALSQAAPSPRGATGDPGPTAFDRGLSRVVIDILEAATAILERDPGGCRDMIRRAAALIRSDEDRRALPPLEAGAAPTLSAWQFRKASEFIEAHLDRSIRLSDVAGCVRLSRGHFSRRFKASCGLSPLSFIAERRVKRAQHQMLVGEASLCEIALDCGFADQAHFSRVFREIVGAPPNQWRRNRRIDPSAETEEPKTAPVPLNA